jgi:hypothetical protein
MSVKLMAQVFEAKFKHPSEKWVMVVLANYANDDGCNAYPSVATIARNAGIAHRTVQTALRNLVAGGFIAQDGVWQSLNGPIARYRIMVDKLSTGATIAPVQPLHPVQPLREGVQPLHPTGATTAQTGATTAPNPSLTIINPSISEERGPADADAPPPGMPPSSESSFSETSPTSSPQFKIVAAMGKSLTPSAIKRINETCTDLKRLQAVVDYCLLLPKCSIPAMLTIYDEWPTHRHNPDAKHTNAGTQKPSNGRQSKGNTFRRPQHAYTSEERERKEAEARERIAAKRGASA